MPHHNDEFDEYDKLIFEKFGKSIPIQEVIDSRKKAEEIIDKINPSYITGWKDLKRKIDEVRNDIRIYLEHRKDLPLKKSLYNASSIKRL